jgi:hypothetical protein
VFIFIKSLWLLRFGDFFYYINVTKHMAHLVAETDNLIMHTTKSSQKR